MSGGYFDYNQHRIHDIAEKLKRNAKTPLHKALAKHLFLVHEAVHALDYELCGDTGTGDADDAIKKIVSKSDVLLCTKEMLDDLIDEAKKVLEEFK